MVAVLRFRRWFRVLISCCWYSDLSAWRTYHDGWAGNGSSAAAVRFSSFKQITIKELWIKIIYLHKNTEEKLYSNDLLSSSSSLLIDIAVESITITHRPMIFTPQNHIAPLTSTNILHPKNLLSHFLRTLQSIAHFTQDLHILRRNLAHRDTVRNLKRQVHSVVIQVSSIFHTSTSTNRTSNSAGRWSGLISTRSSRNFVRYRSKHPSSVLSITWAWTPSTLVDLFPKRWSN